jgi:hypothetical protein
MKKCLCVARPLNSYEYLLTSLLHDVDINKMSLGSDLKRRTWDMYVCIVLCFVLFVIDFYFHRQEYADKAKERFLLHIQYHLIIA